MNVPSVPFGGSFAVVLAYITTLVKGAPRPPFPLPRAELRASFSRAGQPGQSAAPGRSRKGTSLLLPKAPATGCRLLPLKGSCFSLCSLCHKKLKHRVRRYSPCAPCQSFFTHRGCGEAVGWRVDEGDDGGRKIVNSEGRKRVVARKGLVICDLLSGVKMARHRNRTVSALAGRGQAGGVIFWRTNQPSRRTGWNEHTQMPLASRERPDLSGRHPPHSCPPGVCQ